MWLLPCRMCAAAGTERRARAVPARRRQRNRCADRVLRALRTARWGPRLLALVGPGIPLRASRGGAAMPVHPSDRIIGSSPAMARLREQIGRLTAFDAVGNPHVPTLLLQGETGTGKGLVARAVHESGGRASGPLVDVNCAAIPEHLLEAELYGFEVGAFTDARRPKPGLFEAASRGTLFLDEIDALPLSLQGKLLRSIEDKRVRRLGPAAGQGGDGQI